MFDLLLRRARLVDDTLTDIAIRDGKLLRWTAAVTSARAGLTPTFTVIRARRYTMMSRTAWGLLPA